MKVGDPCPHCPAGVMQREVDPSPGSKEPERRLRCAACNGFAWASKPENEQTKRPANHRDLLKKLDAHVCEICMRRDDQLPAPDQLEVHHIDAYAEGGSNEPQNLQPVCTMCHRVIHLLRTYMGHYSNHVESGND